jgi:hypothetical protein
MNNGKDAHKKCESPVYVIFLTSQVNQIYKDLSRIEAQFSLWELPASLQKTL